MLLFNKSSCYPGVNLTIKLLNCWEIRMPVIIVSIYQSYAFFECQFTKHMRFLSVNLPWCKVIKFASYEDVELEDVFAFISVMKLWKLLLTTIFTKIEANAYIIAQICWHIFKKSLSSSKFNQKFTCVWLQSRFNWTPRDLRLI